MKIGKTKYLSLCLVLVGALTCFASCNGDDDLEYGGDMECLPLKAIIWNENMTEMVHEVEPVYPSRIPVYDHATLSLDTTYILEIYIYNESNDPDYNYTDTEISYNMVRFDYDNNYVEITELDSNNSKTSERLYYYLKGTCEVTDTFLGATINGYSVGIKKQGVGLQFESTIYLSFE